MSLSRRRFLGYTGAGVTLAAAAGLGWQFRPTTPSDTPPNRPLPEGTGPSLLVVYGSMMGATGGQAAWVAEAAEQRGYRVQLATVETAPSPETFDAVVIGSAIRAGAWLPEVVDWTGAHAEVIAARPHHLFQGSMTCAGLLEGNAGTPLSPEQSAELRRDCDSLFTAAPALSETEVAFFPGRLEFSRLTPLLRVGYPFVAGSLMAGDYRNRADVDRWANTVLA